MKILFFGRLGETIGREIDYRPSGRRLHGRGAARGAGEAHEGLAAESVRACIDHEIAPETALGPADPRNRLHPAFVGRLRWCGWNRRELRPAEELERFIAGLAGDGAVVSFVGLARPADAAGEAVTGLFLDAYPGMTEKSLDAIAADALEQVRDQRGPYRPPLRRDRAGRADRLRRRRRAAPPRRLRGRRLSDGPAEDRRRLLEARAKALTARPGSSPVKPTAPTARAGATDARNRREPDLPSAADRRADRLGHAHRRDRQIGRSARRAADRRRPSSRRPGDRHRRGRGDPRAGQGLGRRSRGGHRSSAPAAPASPRAT